MDNLFDFETRELIAGQLKIIVRKANVKAGIRRGRLITFAFEHPLDDDDLQTAAFMLYPSLICSSQIFIAETDKRVTAFDPPYTGEIAEANEKGRVKQLEDWQRIIDRITDIPEDLMNSWLEIVYELNPNWQPSKPETKVETEEKKEEATNSTPG
jgi:hypothetical protein